MSIYHFPCGVVTITGAEPRGEQPIPAPEWRDHLADCDEVSCERAAEAAFAPEAGSVPQ